MFRSNTCASLALIIALLAMPALAQQADVEQNQPGAAASADSPAPQQAGAASMMLGTCGTPTMVINNTFNPTGPTGTGTFNPSGKFVIRLNEGCGVGRDRLPGTDGALGAMGIMLGVPNHLEGRIAFVKTELKITDSQLPLWNAVADAIRDNAKTWRLCLLK